MDATEGGYFETRRRAVPSLEMWRERSQLERDYLAVLLGEGVTERDIERWETGAEHPTLAEIYGRITATELDDLLRPESYLGLAPEFVDRVLERTA